ncbi:MAG TPA: Asd/ArgC dimerization domain-containing protein [Clostridia bacterium]|nr:Asd/ArgC dimerization domain-containing protein [Clostridia bacterium]
MKRSKKSGEAIGWGGLFRVAVVGAATLKGKELKDVLSERNFPSNEVKLLDDEDALGTLENVGDEPTFIQSVLPEHLENVDFTFFASDEEFTARTWREARERGSEIIDLSYALENEPGVILRAPWIEDELGKPHPVELVTAPVVVAHPAAVVLALLTTRIEKLRHIEHASATILEPASERGKGGMDELHDQTVNLLSFQQMPTNVFGTQIAFNMVPGYGQESRPSLNQVEERIRRHFEKMCGDVAKAPSLMLLQAPVFHAHTFSIYIELQSPASLQEMETAIMGDHVEIARTFEDTPTNVNVAGQEQVQVLVRRDTQRENGFWIWAASDNLRITANMAVECAESMAATRPRGKVQ